MRIGVNVDAVLMDGEEIKSTCKTTTADGDRASGRKRQGLDRPNSRWPISVSNMPHHGVVRANRLERGRVAQ